MNPMFYVGFTEHIEMVFLICNWYCSDFLIILSLISETLIVIPADLSLSISKLLLPLLHFSVLGNYAATKKIIKGREFIWNRSISKNTGNIVLKKVLIESCS